MTPVCVLALHLAATVPLAELENVQFATREGRPSLNLVFSTDPGEVRLTRVGGEVHITANAAQGIGLHLPPPVPPVQNLRLEVDGTKVVLALVLGQGVSYELRNESDRRVFFLLFAAGSDVPPQEAAFEALYQRLFPAEDEAGGEAGGQAGGQVAGGRGAESKPKTPEADRPGYGIGPFRLQPAITIAFVASDASITEGPAPVEERHVEITPSLGLNLDLFDGRFNAKYQPRFRRYSSRKEKETERTLHLFDVTFTVPVASTITVRAVDHFSLGVLETAEVDPGREYFYGLGRFRRNQLSVGARYDSGARLSLDVSRTQNTVRFYGGSQFIPFDRVFYSAQAVFEMTAGIRLSGAWGLDRVPPPPTRAVSEWSARTLTVALEGDLGTFANSAVAVTHRVQDNPNAPEQGRRFSGMTVTGRLAKEWSPNSRTSLNGYRTVHLSAFEDNPYYVATGLTAEQNLGGPWGTVLNGALAWQWNRYAVDSAQLGRPREDRLSAWSVGLGRSLGRRAFVRLDYRRERRDSNLDFLDNRTGGVLFQLAVDFSRRAGAGQQP